MNGKGYGMPSSHAQFLAFFSLSLSLFLLVRHRPPPQSAQTSPFDPAHYHKPLTVVQRVLFSILMLVVAAAVAWSRTYLEYHTPLQVWAGCTAGAGSAAAWFVATSWLRWTGWVEWGCESWMGKAWRFRDLVVEEDLAEAGWRRWVDRTVGRQTDKSGLVANSKELKGKKNS